MVYYTPIPHTSSITHEHLNESIDETKANLSNMGIKVLDFEVVKTSNAVIHPGDYQTFTSSAYQTICTNYTVIWKTEMPHSLALDLVNLADVMKTQRLHINDVEERYAFCSRRLDATRTKLKLISEFLTKNPSAIEVWNQLVVLAKLNDIDLDLTKV